MHHTCAPRPAPRLAPPGPAPPGLDLSLGTPWPTPGGHRNMAHLPRLYLRGPVLAPGHSLDARSAGHPSLLPTRTPPALRPRSYPPRPPCSQLPRSHCHVHTLHVHTYHVHTYHVHTYHLHTHHVHTTMSNLPRSRLPCTHLGDNCICTPRRMPVDRTVYTHMGMYGSPFHRVAARSLVFEVRFISSVLT